MAQPFWTDLVQRLTPYVPGEQRHGDNIVKLNTNENPYPPSDKVLSSIGAVNGDSLRRYPDPESTELRQVLADYHQLSIDNVFVGNGSDEILALAFMAFFTGKAALQFPLHSYSFYPVYCDLLNIETRVLPMLSDFAIDMDAFQNNGGGIVFPNPNAPTSLAQPLESIIGLLDRVPDTVVLVDEAYVDFGAESAVELVTRYSNLIVTQTFSKSRSLAGMRLGVAYANPSLIEAMQRVKNSFNSYPVDALAQRAGVASMLDDDYYRQTVQKIMSTRDSCTSELQHRGYTVLDSSANFVFASPPNGNADDIFALLNENGVLVRYWPKADLANWLRISIGTDTDMQALYSVIDKT